MQIVREEDDPEHVRLLMWYRYPETPMLQLEAIMQRERSADGDCVLFDTIAGLPLHAQLHVQHVSEDKCEVHVHVQHAVPTLLDECVGRAQFKGHVRSILRENVEVPPPPAHAATPLPSCPSEQ